MKLQKATLIGLLTSILLLSVILVHFLPAVGILTSPIIIALIAGLIVYTNDSFNLIIKSVLAYLFIGLNDIGIKLFSGGIHDTEGLGWINLMLIAGSVLAFIMLIIGVLRDNKGTAYWIKAVSILIFILLIYIHLQVFQSLGVPAN